MEKHRLNYENSYQLHSWRKRACVNFRNKKRIIRNRVETFRKIIGVYGGRIIE